MKSFSSAVNESDARLFRYARPNPLHEPGGRMFDPVRSIAASPNVLVDSVRGLLGAIGSTTGTLLIAPSANPLSAWTLPQHGKVLLAWQTWLAVPVVTQRWMPSTGTVPRVSK